MGTALAQALESAGVRVEAVASRTQAHAVALAGDLAHTRVVPLAEAGSAAPIVLLTVADSAIEVACESIQAAPGAIVAHASGSRDVGALEHARRRGARVGGFHPLAAVPRGHPAELGPVRSVALFRGAVFAIEGDEDVQAGLAPLAVALGGRWWSIQAKDKPRYHLGASMLAAFSAGLAQVAWNQMRAAGAPEELASAGVGHLLVTVGANITRADAPASAQTGPVARGDVAAIVRQAEAARALSPEALQLYLAHVTHNIRLAHDDARIDDVTARSLRDALGNYRNE